MHVEWKADSILVEEFPQIVRDMFEYNPDQAREMLAKAGYPDGFKTKVECLKTHVEILSIVQVYLADVGVEMEIVLLETGAFSSKKYAHDYDQMLPWTVGTMTPCFQSSPEGALLSNYRYPSLYNYPNFDDAWFNETLDEARTIQDYDARVKVLKELAVYVLEKSPYILPPAPYGYTFWAPWLKGSHPDGYFGQVTPKWEWYGPQAAHFWLDQDLKESMIGQR